MVAQVVREIEAEQYKSEIPEFGPGDTVRVTLSRGEIEAKVSKSE